MSLTECRHHFILGPIEDGLVTGKCRYCEAEETYIAIWEIYEDRRLLDAAKRILSSKDGSGRKPDGYWESRKLQILDSIEVLGEEPAVRMWEIPRGTWAVKRIKWGLPRQRRSPGKKLVLIGK